MDDEAVDRAFVQVRQRDDCRVGSSQLRNIINLILGRTALTDRHAREAKMTHSQEALEVSGLTRGMICDGENWMHNAIRDIVNHVIESKVWSCAIHC